MGIADDLKVPDYFVYMEHSGASKPGILIFKQYHFVVDFIESVANTHQYPSVPISTHQYDGYFWYVIITQNYFTPK